MRREVSPLSQYRSTTRLLHKVVLTVGGQMFYLLLVVLPLLPRSSPRLTSVWAVDGKILPGTPGMYESTPVSVVDSTGCGILVTLDFKQRTLYSIQ